MYLTVFAARGLGLMLIFHGLGLWQPAYKLQVSCTLWLLQMLMKHMAALQMPAVGQTSRTACARMGIWHPECLLLGT